jgi:hypothetical protein
MSYIRGKYAKAACALLDNLNGKGIACSVGYDAKKGKKDKTLIVRYRSGDLSQIQSFWQGFTVVLECEAPAK